MNAQDQLEHKNRLSVTARIHPSNAVYCLSMAHYAEIGLELDANGVKELWEAFIDKHLDCVQLQKIIEDRGIGKC